MDGDVEMQASPSFSSTNGHPMSVTANGREAPRRGSMDARGHQSSKPSSTRSKASIIEVHSSDHVMQEPEAFPGDPEESWPEDEEEDEVDALLPTQAPSVVLDPNATESEEEPEEGDEPPVPGEFSHDEEEHGERSEHDENAVEAEAEAESDSGSEDDDDSDDGAEPEDNGNVTMADPPLPPPDADTGELTTLPSADVPSDAAQGDAPVAGPSTQSKKPVRRRRSPSATPPPPPPPLKTIRLNLPIRLPDADEYAVVDIAALARSSGQIPTTPTPAAKARPESSDTEKDEEGKKAKAKRKKRGGANGDVYDVHDPFIDDSELAQDERTTFAQTKQQGFYVSSGEVALLKDEKGARKPKSRKITGQVGEAGASGTRDDPHAVSGDENDSVGAKRKRYTTVTENGKRRKLMDLTSYHEELQPDLLKLQAAIAAENWDNKSKFPPELKPLLRDVAVKAVRLDEYDDDFFHLMTTLFPYNRFTMMKLVKRLIFTDHNTILLERQDVLLAKLSKIATDGFERAKEELSKAQTLWEEKMAKVNAPAKGPNGEDTVMAPPCPEVAPDTAGHEEGVPDAAGSKSKLPPKPVQRFRMTDEMKEILWDLVTISNECCRLENERNSLEGSTATVSEQGTRKVLYQKILAAFPVDWMSTGQLSREVSMMKKKHEKAAGES